MKFFSSFKNLSQRRRDQILIAVLCVLMLGVAEIVVPLAGKASPWTGQLEVYSNNSGYCLTTTGGSAGDTVELNPCTSQASDNQIWTLNDIKKTEVLSVSDVQEFSLQSAAGSDVCLSDDDSSRTTIGSHAVLSTCSTSDANDTWVWGVKLTSLGYSRHQLVNVGTLDGRSYTLCLDDYWGDDAAKSKVALYECKISSQANQNWFENGAQDEIGAANQSLGTSSDSPTGSAGINSSNSSTPASSTAASAAGSPSGGCTSGSAAAPCIGSATTGAGGWGSPVFDDEFNGTSLGSQWAPSWFNGGKVNNDNGVNMLASNVSVSGGNVNLTLSSSSDGATIDTDATQGGGGFTFTTGYYVEARMYIPGSGSTIYNWPAFWTDGQSWPADGESDIFEGLGDATSNYHSPQGANNSGTIPGTWSNGWHTYAMDREAGKDSIYWDGKLVRSYTPDDGGAPQYIILSLDCSGGCTTGPSAQLKVDYVRAWKKQ